MRNASKTFLAGLFGMNFADIPGAQARHGFVWTVGGMVALAVASFLFFKRKRWI